MSQQIDPGQPIDFGSGSQSGGSNQSQSPQDNTYSNSSVPVQQPQQNVQSTDSNRTVRPQRPNIRQNTQPMAAPQVSNQNDDQNDFQAPPVRQAPRPFAQMAPRPLAPSQNPARPVSPAFPPLPDDYDDIDDDDDGFNGMPFGPMTPPQQPNAFMPRPAAPLGNMPGQGQMSLSKMPEDQRRDVITRVFKLVLGRDPLDKDFNYYRFSALTEDGLVRNVLNLAEHKSLVENAKQFTTLKASNNDLDLRVKLLETNQKSVQSELVTLQSMLSEKNRYIQNLRSTIQSLSQGHEASPAFWQEEARQEQMQMAQNNQMQAQQPMQQEQSYQQPYQQPQQYDARAQQANAIRNTLPSPFDEIKNFFRSILRIFGLGR